jgi:hypothetical protein
MIIYLYKKTHNQTGLKYLGKTTSPDPHKYTGSGRKWKPHIKKHGYDVTTEILKECQSKEEVKCWGKYYSDLWDVVNSKDWANLKPEEGDGGPTVFGEDHPSKRPEVVEKIKSSWTPEKRERAGKEISKRIASRNPAKQQDINKKIKKARDNDPLRKESLSKRMTYSNPGIDPVIKEKIARTKSSWSEEKKKEVIAKTSGLNHYRKNPNYVSTQVGHGHPRFNETLYTFRNKNTNEVVVSTVYDLIKKYNLHQGNTSLVVNGIRKSVMGWELVS